MPTRVDHTALKVNQTAVIALLLLAFLLDQPWLVLFVAAVMLIGTIWPQAGLFKLVYVRLLKPAGLLKPDVQQDEPQPHLFAQGVGAIVLIVAVVAFAAGLSIVGWALSLIVVVLAGVNLFAGFCLGCFFYYQLARRGWRPQLGRWQPAEVRVEIPAENQRS